MTQLAPQRVEAASVDELLAGWAASASGHRDQALALDLSQVERLERTAGVFVANALLGSLNEVPLRIYLPDDLDHLKASGLGFALANRSGATEVLPRGRRIDMAVWRRPWTPASQLPLFESERGDTLFAPADIGETDLLPDLRGRSFAAFCEPHLASAGSTQQHPVATAAWPWIDELLPSRRKSWPQFERQRQLFIGAVGRMLSETVINIQEHARPSNGRLHSLVQLSVTSGGGGDRLYVSIQDNGAGIAATARPKVDPVSAAQLSDHQLIYKLFEGTLPPWGQGRGLGLPKVTDLIRRYRGSLRVATGTTRVRISPETQALTTSDAPFAMKGTAFVVMLRLPTR